MFKKNHRITLNVRDEASRVMLSARKGDRQRKLSIRLADGRDPYRLPDGCYAVFNARRGDGAVFFGDCVMSGDVIEYELDAAVASVIGRLDCDITVYSADGDVLTSPKFGITVYAGATSTEEIEDTDEYRTLGQLVSEAREIQDENKDIAEELEELKDGIAVELEEAGKTIEGFNEWYGQTSAELSRLSGELNVAVTEANDATAAAETRTTQLISDTEKTCEDLVSDTEKLCEDLKTDVETSMAEFTSVGRYATVPAKNWSNDTDLLTKQARAQRIAYKSSANDMKLIIDHNWGAATDAILSEDWQTFEATFTYAPKDYTGGLWLVFYGGKNEIFCHPYDIADVKLWRASDADRTNLFPEDIAKLNWWWHHDTESCLEMNRFSVAFDDDGHKYIHVWRQHTYVSPDGTMNGNMAYLRAGTGVKLNVGETYVLSCRMRTTCAQHTAIVPFDGIRAASSTTVTPCVSSAEAAADCKCRAFGQRIGELMFRADTVPSSDMLFGVTATTGEGGIILNCAAANVASGGAKIVTGSYTGNGYGSIDYQCRVEETDDYYHIKITAIDAYDSSIVRIELPFAPSGILIMAQGKVYSLAAGGNINRKIELIEVDVKTGLASVNAGVGAVVTTARLSGKYLELVSSSSLTCTVNYNDIGESYKIKLDGETFNTTGSIDLKNELNQSGVVYQYIIW